MFDSLLFAGQRLPIADAHTVTLKQLLALHKLQQQQAHKQQGNEKEHGQPKGKPADQVKSRSHRGHVPLYISRALPGIHAHEFNQMIKGPFFLLTRAYVCEAAAVPLLRMALEV
jgi:hypothetical protein